MKKLLILLAVAAFAVGEAKADDVTYYAVGNLTEIFTSSWEGGKIDANKMIKYGDEEIYYKIYKDIHISESKELKCKVVKVVPGQVDNQWIASDESSYRDTPDGNATAPDDLTAGTYDFIVILKDNKAYLNYISKSDCMVITGDETTLSALGVTSPSEWSSQINMSLDGTEPYTWTYTASSVDLSAADTDLHFKVKRTEDWNDFWTYGKNGRRKETDDTNQDYNNIAAGYYDITIKCDFIKMTCWATVTTPVANNYYVFGGFNDAAFSEVRSMTKDGTDYSFTFDNQTSPSTFKFVILPDFAMNDGATAIRSDNAWSYAYRPTSAHKVFTFANEEIDATVSGGDYNWQINMPVKLDFVLHQATSKLNVAPYFTREINSIGYSTFSSDYAVAIPEGVTAYYASGANSSTKKVTMTKFENGIAANTGALLYKSGGGEVTFTPATSTDNVSGSNLLKETTGSDIYNSSKAQYVLAKAKNSNDVSTIAFKKVGSSYSPAKGSAYLETESALAPSFEIFFDHAAGGTTAIDAVKSAEPAVTDGAYYNLAGQRVTNPTKGLYIVNGRKVVVK